MTDEALWIAAAATTEVAVERLGDGARIGARDRAAVEAPLELRARGVPVATIMRTPGHDLELVAGLLHAEAVACTGLAQHGADLVDADADPAAFAGRGLLASAACGVCGRAAIADLELRAREVDSDATIAASAIAAMPAALSAAQVGFAETGGLHAAGLFTLGGALVAAREDVGRHNAVDKLVGWARGAHLDGGRHALFLSGRLGYELVQKAIRFGVPVLAAVSAPSSLAISLAERFGVALVGFVRGGRCNVYSHGWRVS
jgi:FdhD protein